MTSGCRFADYDQEADDEDNEDEDNDDEDDDGPKKMFRPLMKSSQGYPKQRRRTW